MSLLLTLRAVFVTLLLATVAGKIYFAPPPLVDMRAAVSGVLALQGFRSRLSPQGPERALASVDVEAPGCADVVQIMPINLDVWEGPWLQEALSPNTSKRIVYLDRTWPTADRIGMRLEWLKHKALSIFGLSRYVVGPAALLVVEPPNCRAADTIDWRMMWDRQTLLELSLRAI